MTSVGAAQIEERIAALVESRNELLAALKSLVGYLRTEERWPVEADHMAYLRYAESAIKNAEGR